MGFPPTREELAGQPADLLSPGRNWTKGEVRLLHWNGRPLVVKDFHSAHPLFRGLLGAWVTRHEDAIFRELHGLRGVPASFGRIDRLAFAREFVDGRPLQAFRPGEVAGATFEHLETIIRGLHARGIAHGDLHHRDIILTREGEPFVIDFSYAVHRGRGWNPLRRWLFHQYCRMDLRSVFKLKSRFLEAPLSIQEAGFLRDAPILHRVGKRVRRLFRPEAAGNRCNRHP